MTDTKKPQEIATEDLDKVTGAGVAIPDATDDARKGVIVHEAKKGVVVHERG